MSVYPHSNIYQINFKTAFNKLFKNVKNSINILDILVFKNRTLISQFILVEYFCKRFYIVVFF